MPEGGQRGRIAAFREGDAARVEHYRPVCRPCQFPEMGMSIADCIIPMTSGRQVVLMIDMSMGEQQSVAQE